MNLLTFVTSRFPKWVKQCLLYANDLICYRFLEFFHQKCSWTVGTHQCNVANALQQKKNERKNSDLRILVEVSSPLTNYQFIYSGNFPFNMLTPRSFFQYTRSMFGLIATCNTVILRFRCQSLFKFLMDQFKSFTERI